MCFHLRTMGYTLMSLSLSWDKQKTNKITKVIIKMQTWTSEKKLKQK
jgi:hypothetical protein